MNMKIWVLILLPVFVAAGCSDSSEPSKSEQLGKEIADQMRAPIDDARAVTEKLNKRELPPMDE